MEVALARRLKEADTPQLTSHLIESNVEAADSFSHPEALRQIAYKDTSRLKLTSVLCWDCIRADSIYVQGFGRLPWLEMLIGEHRLNKTTQRGG